MARKSVQALMNNGPLRCLLVLGLVVALAFFPPSQAGAHGQQVLNTVAAADFDCSGTTSVSERTDQERGHIHHHGDHSHDLPLFSCGNLGANGMWMSSWQLPLDAGPANFLNLGIEQPPKQA